MMSGVILAGGLRGRQDGETIALLPFAGEILLQRQIKELRKVCDDILISVDDPKPFLTAVETDIRIITEFYPGNGPLGGMHSGLSLAKYSSVWIVGCGMPFLSAKAALTLHKLQQRGMDAAVPLSGGTRIALHGVYSKDCAAQIQRLLDSGGGEATLDKLMETLRIVDAAEELFAAAGINPHFTMDLDSVDHYRANAVKPQLNGGKGNNSEQSR